MDDTDQHRTPTIGPFTTAQLYDSIPIPSGSQCIPVLDIPKRPLAADECLTGTLRIVDLRNSPKFTALSYVDAVCINQDNTDEKAHQIPLMGEIYTWAEVVYIWLGDGSRAADKAMKYIRAASEHRLFPAGVPWWDGTRPITVNKDRNRLWWGIFFLGLRRVQERSNRRHDFGVLRGCDRVSLLELLDQTLLHRSWTFQEATLASNPIVVCGQEHATWVQLHQDLTFIQDSVSRFYDKDDISTVARNERR
ncbi:heterokaryon incompatibility protein-domain-containing protein [Fusarium solani]|uniref:Heterokaryon incompatibility protein-domain-containing protein n=1 Tax=Fusarium solani TaxID=169388 RepID=A0A9P9G247_FUSSL|nr:heterokaryon incompatibility protein-domain-containing protein [Fusarium solani]KAH7230690.1 heterokaryon incompatibility protein-domain-containing protein [Fusarium solani]